MTNHASPRILVLNGPNLDMLGEREPELYGHETLADVELRCREAGARRGVEIECLQSNHEGELIDRIHAARDRAGAETSAAGIVLNAGGLTHTSVALRDALSAAAVPFVEVHLTNVHAREAFRHHSYLSGIAEAVIVGAGTTGYLWAIELLAARFETAGGSPDGRGEVPHAGAAARASEVAR